MGLLSTAITVGIVTAGLAFLVAIIPAYPLPQEFLDAITTIITYIEPWGYFVNFDALLDVVVVVTVFEFIYFGIRVAIWVFDEIFDRA